jgi:hypothetical protein
MNREELLNQYVDLMFVSEDKELDEAIIGVAERCGFGPVVVYHVETLIQGLMKLHGWDYEEALEWYEFNILGGYYGEKNPLFLNKLDEL